MAKIRLYFPKVLLTFLFVFVLIGTELTVLVRHKALTFGAFQTVAEQQALDDKAYTVLENYFQSRSNSTGIPKEVYLNAIDKTDLKQGILDSVSLAFDYLNGKSDGYAFDMNFTELETSVSQFFNDYADEHDYQKDEVFQEKINSAVSEAESEILFVADTFKFSTMYENGWLAKVKKLVTLLSSVTAGFCIMTAILIILLIICCKKQLSELLYWLGLAGLIAGLLVSVPSLYILKTDYFSGFVVKDPQIFAAVTGYLQFMTNQIFSTAACTAGIGILCLVIFSILGHKNDKM